MDRRAFLKSAGRAGALAAVGGLATPAISQRADARTVRFKPHADLTNFDPIWTTAYMARNAGVLVWDTLYGVDADLKPQRQMIEAEEVSADELIWTFRLRPGVKFHDGEPVLAKDAVASINRWAARDPMGQMLKAIENELAIVDDRTFRWVLKKPYPKMLLALGKISAPCCFVMPARVAATDPFEKINEYIGSGPMRFARNEWVAGVRAVFTKFPDYVPRQEEPSWLAGGKRIVADRIEWIVIPDAGVAAAALHAGEIDWIEVISPDLAPMLRNNRNLIVDICDPLGLIGVLAMNHLFPPFNDLRARRAILMVLNQEEYMHAFVGDDARLWKPMVGYFTPGTPLYNEEGGDILKGPRKLDAAKRLVVESGYAGQSVTLMAGQDLLSHKAWGDVTADLLRRLGVNVDYAAVDFGTVAARRVQKNPPGQGGWQMHIASPAGVDLVRPTHLFLRADGSTAINGWPTSPAVETEIAAWFEATSLDEEKAAARRLNKAAFDHVIYAPLGCCLLQHAWRRNLAGVSPGPLPFFWGVSKSV
jgi:peptide/nickel transport system substrate-binding protein